VSLLMPPEIARRFGVLDAFARTTPPNDMPTPRVGSHPIQLDVVDNRLALFGEPDALAVHWEDLRKLAWDPDYEVWRPRTLAEIDQLPAVVTPAARPFLADLEDVVHFHTPAGLEVPLRRTAGVIPMPHQYANVDRIVLEQPRVLLADDPGLGKTLSAVMAVAATAPHRVLIVAPKQLVVTVWSRTLRALDPTHLASEVVVSTQPGGVIANASVLIAHPESVVAMAEELAAQHWDAVIIDEAHWYANAGTQRTLAVLGGEQGSGVLGHASMIILATGTPARNRPEDLWPLLRVVDAEGLGADRAAYVRRFGGRIKQQRQRELACALRPLLIRHRVEDTLELPRNTIRTVILPQSAETSRLVEEERLALRNYKASQNARRRRLQRGEMPPRSQLSRLRAELAFAKVPAVAEMVEGLLERHEPVVVFGHHVQPLRDLAARFGARARLIIGATPDVERIQAADAFQAGRCDVVLASYEAAATGLTLTRAAHLVAVELPWVAATFIQATRRIARIGQNRPTTTLVCAFDGSIDAIVGSVLQRKHAVLSGIFDDRLPSKDELPLDEGIDLGDLAGGALVVEADARIG